MRCHNQPRTDTVEGIAGPLKIESIHYKRYMLNSKKVCCKKQKHFTLSPIVWASTLVMKALGEL